MKLHRNTNADGRGKYALVNLELLKKTPHLQEYLDALKMAGVLTYGNEEPGEQFFVMRYKDKFTARGLEGYANAVRSRILVCEDNLSALVGVEGERADRLRQENQAQLDDLTEWVAEIEAEALKADKLGVKLPD